MYPNSADLFVSNDSQQKSRNYLTEPVSHFSLAHSLSKCCLNSRDPVEAAHHNTYRPDLTWSNVGCELEKARVHFDFDRENECLDLLNQSWVLTNLGHHRIAKIVKRFQVYSLQERIALQKIVKHLRKIEQKGRTPCQFATRIDFNFIEYLDSKRSASPSSYITLNHASVRNSTLLRIMKWAHANDDMTVLSLMEQFLLVDEEEKYFNHYMLLHIANRFNFPTLRMRCLSSLRTVNCIEDFQSSSNYMDHISSIDREQIEKRLEIFRDYQDMGVKVPDEVYQFDLHSGCYFNESIQARYLPDAYLSNTDTDDDSMCGGGGEIVGIDFEYVNSLIP